MSAEIPGPRAMAFRLAEGITRELGALTVNAKARPDDEWVQVPRDEFDALASLHRRAKAVTSELDRTDLSVAS